MHSFKFLSLLAVFSIATAAFAAPVSNSRPSSPSFDPTRTFAHGEYVGVRPTAYEEKHPSHKKISIHPGIIVGGPDPHTGKHDVVMISKKPPFDPPQAPIEHFQTGTGIYGNVVLKARPVSPGAMKPWVDPTTNARQAPLVGEGYKKLKKAMGPHVNWEPPKFPPKRPKAPKKSPNAHNGPAHPARQGGHPAGNNNNKGHGNKAVGGHGQLRRPSNPGNAQHGNQAGSSHGLNGHKGPAVPKPQHRPAHNGGIVNPGTTWHHPISGGSITSKNWRSASPNRGTARQMQKSSNHADGRSSPSPQRKNSPGHAKGPQNKMSAPNHNKGKH